MITREENHDVLLVKDYLGDHHIAVKATEDRLWALTRWVSGKLEIFKNTDGEREVYIFFKSNRVQSYVRPNQWVMKDDAGRYVAVSEDYIQYLRNDPLYETQPYHAQLWYQT